MAAMKHSAGKFGICMMENGKYVVQDRKSEKAYVFDSVEALVKDGWAID